MVETKITFDRDDRSLRNKRTFEPRDSMGIKLGHEEIHETSELRSGITYGLNSIERVEKADFDYSKSMQIRICSDSNSECENFIKDRTINVNTLISCDNLKINEPYKGPKNNKTSKSIGTPVKELTAKKAEVNPNGILEEAKTQDLNLLAHEVVSRNHFIHHDDVLYMFDGTCYAKMSEKAMMIYLRKHLAKFCQYLKKSDYSEIYNNITIHPDVQVEKLPTPREDLVCFRNGILDVGNNMLIGHSPHHYFFSTLNVDYTDEAYVNNGVFDNFIHTASCGDNQVRTQVLELIALTILGYQVKAFFVIVGPTGSGKSQFGRFLSELFGHEAVTSINSVSDFSKNFGLSQIQKKKLVMCMDLPDDNLPKSAIGIMKQFVGDDMLNINIKYKNSLTIYDKPVLLCASNHAIKLSSKDKAVEERMVLIPFIGTPKVKVPKLYEQLVLEAPYIVKEAFKMLRGLKQRAYEPTRAYVPAEYAFGGGNKTERCIAEFIQTHIVEDEGSKITTEDIYANFKTMNSEISYIDFSRIFKQSVLKFYSQAIYKRNLINGTKSGYVGININNLI